jgi:DNA-binding CsgD family transcriptional regulator
MAAMNPAAIVREFAGLAAEPGGLAERADALLRQVLRVVRSDAGLITLLPPDEDRYLSLARSGYDERIRRFQEGSAYLEDVELAGLRRARRPVRLRDLPVPPSELIGWAEYLEPAGFRDGMGTALFTSDGRYLGALGLDTEAAGAMTDAVRELVGLLATPIAAGVDPWRSLTTIAGLVEGATAGIVLTPSGLVQPLPGLPAHPLLDVGSGVLAVATAQLTEGGLHASFLAPLPATGEEAAQDGAATHVRITVLAAPRDVRCFAAAVVLVGPPGEVHGLSAQELQVLGLLVTGASNERIAVALGISRRTVEGHVDHVRAKLAGRSRTAAVARALRLGLFVPPALFVRRSARAPRGTPPP